MLIKHSTDWQGGTEAVISNRL